MNIAELHNSNVKRFVEDLPMQYMYNFNVIEDNTLICKKTGFVLRRPIIKKLFQNHNDREVIGYKEVFAFV